MKVIISLLFVIFAIFILFLIIKDKFNTRNKIIAIIFFIFIILIICIYTYRTNKINENEFDLINAFNRKENLKCDGVIVNSDNFTFSNGTLSFVGNKNTSVYGKILSIKQCSL